MTLPLGPVSNVAAWKWSFGGALVGGAIAGPPGALVGGAIGAAGGAVAGEAAEGDDEAGSGAGGAAGAVVGSFALVVWLTACLPLRPSGQGLAFVRFAGDRCEGPAGVA